MDFIARDLDAVPILLAQALASDQEVWAVRLLDADDRVIVFGELHSANWQRAVIQPLDEDTEPVGEPVEVQWDNVGTIVVP